MAKHTKTQPGAREARAANVLRADLSAKLWRDACHYSNLRDRVRPKTDGEVERLMDVSNLYRVGR